MNTIITKLNCTGRVLNGSFMRIVRSDFSILLPMKHGIAEKSLDNPLR